MFSSKMDGEIGTWKGRIFTFDSEGGDSDHGVRSELVGQHWTAGIAGAGVALLRPGADLLVADEVLRNGVVDGETSVL